MLIYTCPACLNGTHSACYGTQHPPPGVFGGSKCDCQCRHGDYQEQIADADWIGCDAPDPTPPEQNKTGTP